MEAEALGNGAHSAVPDGECFLASVPEKEYPRLVPPPDSPKQEEAKNEPPKLAETSRARNVEPKLQSVVTRLKAVAAALWSEARRIAKLTTLKMRLARLKGVDLKAAHYVFGKKCYELSLLKEKFATEFTAIGELQKQIAERKAGKASEAQETKMQKAKRVFGNLAGKAEAFFFARRLRKKLIAFGRVAAADGSTDGAQAELERVKLVQRQISKSEEEHAALSKNSTGAQIHPARYWAAIASIALLTCVLLHFTLPHSTTIETTNESGTKSLSPNSAPRQRNYVNEQGEEVVGVTVEDFEKIKAQLIGRPGGDRHFGAGAERFGPITEREADAMARGMINGLTSKRPSSQMDSRKSESATVNVVPSSNDSTHHKQNASSSDQPFVAVHADFDPLLIKKMETLQTYPPAFNGERRPYEFPDSPKIPTLHPLSATRETITQDDQNLELWYTDPTNLRLEISTKDFGSMGQFQFTTEELMKFIELFKSYRLWREKAVAANVIGGTKLIGTFGEQTLTFIGPDRLQISNEQSRRILEEHILRGTQQYSPKMADAINNILTEGVTRLNARVTATLSANLDELALYKAKKESKKREEALYKAEAQRKLNEALK